MGEVIIDELFEDDDKGPSSNACSFLEFSISVPLSNLNVTKDIFRIIIMNQILFTCHKVWKFLEYAHFLILGRTSRKI